MRRGSPLIGGIVLLGLLAGCGTTSSTGVFVPMGSISPQQTEGAQPAGGATGSGSPADPFPGEVSFDFASMPTAPQSAQVAMTDETYQLDYYDAIYTKGKNKQFKSLIGSGGMLQGVDSDLSTLIAEHRGFSGTMRFFDITVSVAGGGAKDVNFCVDQSKLRYTNITTGASLGAVRPSAYLESDTLAKAKHGTWKLIATSSVDYPEGKAKTCKP